MSQLTTPFSILYTGHVEVRVTDLERARAFYVDTLGMVETEREPGKIYLRGIDEPFHHGLTLRKADCYGIGHHAFRVSSNDDLDSLERLHKEKGLPTRKIPAGHEKGQGEALRVEDPMGFPIEFYHEMDRAEGMMGKAAYKRGIEVMRIDHVTNYTNDTNKAFEYYTSVLGFSATSYLVNEKGEMKRVFLRRKQTTHDVAFLQQPGPRNHHVAVWLKNESDIIRACDILATSGYRDKVELWPGRHGPTSLSMYVRDPEGNRVELYHEDRLFTGPEYQHVQKISSSVEDTEMKRGFPFWGMPAPRSYIEEGPPVESIIDGSLKPSNPPILAPMV